MQRPSRESARFASVRFEGSIHFRSTIKSSRTFGAAAFYGRTFPGAPLDGGRYLTYAEGYNGGETIQNKPGYEPNQAGGHCGNDGGSHWNGVFSGVSGVPLDRAHGLSAVLLLHDGGDALYPRYQELCFAAGPVCADFTALLDPGVLSP